MARILVFLLALGGLSTAFTQTAGAAGTGLTLDPCALLHTTVTYTLLGVDTASAARVHFSARSRDDGWASCAASLSKAGRNISLSLTQSAALKLHYDYKQRACSSDTCIAQTERAKARASAAYDFYCSAYPHMKKLDFWPSEMHMNAAPGDRAFTSMMGLYILRGDAEMIVYVTAPDKERKLQLEAEGVASNDLAAATRIANALVTKLSQAAPAAKPACPSF